VQQLQFVMAPQHRHRLALSSAAQCQVIPGRIPSANTRTNLADLFLVSKEFPDLFLVSKEFDLFLVSKEFPAQTLGAIQIYFSFQRSSVHVTRREENLKQARSDACTQAYFAA